VGLLGWKQLRRRSAARRAAVGRRGRNVGEQAGRPDNARAREGPRGVGGGYCGAWTRGGAEDGGAHQRPSAGGDGGRCAAARYCARANAREEEGMGRRAGLLARLHASWLGQRQRARVARVRMAVGPATMASVWSTP
jgi:hypothetical protein